jgi:hypothetical protein
MEGAAREHVARLRAPQPYLEDLGRLDELEDQVTLEPAASASQMLLQAE